MPHVLSNALLVTTTMKFRPDGFAPLRQDQLVATAVAYRTETLCSSATESMLFVDGSWSYLWASCKPITVIMYNPITCQLARSWPLKWWYEEADWLGSLRRLDGFMWASFLFFGLLPKKELFWFFLKYDFWGPKIGNVPGASCRLGAMFQARWVAFWDTLGLRACWGIACL